VCKVGNNLPEQALKQRGSTFGGPTADVVGQTLKSTRQVSLVQAKKAK
jgi:hypothetical protein